MNSIIIADPSFNFELIKELEKNTSWNFIHAPLPLEKKHLNEATALFIRTRIKVNEEFLSYAPNLKVIISGTSGQEHIDKNLCASRGIKVAFTGHVLAPFVAEFTLLLMLQLSWKSSLAMNAIQDGKWKDHLKVGCSLNQKTLGIIGFGSIGQELVEKVKAFNMEILTCNSVTRNSVTRNSVTRNSVTRSSTNSEKPNVSETHFCSQEELLQRSDFVVLSTSYRPSNEKLMCAKKFSLMKPSSYFINISRGNFVCEDSLLQAVEKNTIQGAALDVFLEEPLSKKSTLINNESIILTPHYATHNRQALDLLTKKSFEKLCELFKA